MGSHCGRPSQLFQTFFQNQALASLTHIVDLALLEDGHDLTSQALFSHKDQMAAEIVAKEPLIIAGLPLIPHIFSRINQESPITLLTLTSDGISLPPNFVVAKLNGSAQAILKAERIILNFLCHLSGIATLTRRYVEAIKGTQTRLLDTRKTMPGLRYLDKYAVLVGGGINHRKNLEEMLMLKDNHIDRVGSIELAVARLRSTYDPCPPIEVECRTITHVSEAIRAHPERIMLDNMAEPDIVQALSLIPKGIETEVSGGISLDNIGRIATLGPDFISVGAITHSARSMDLSLRFLRDQ